MSDRVAELEALLAELLDHARGWEDLITGDRGPDDGEAKELFDRVQAALDLGEKP